MDNSILTVSICIIHQNEKKLKKKVSITNSFLSILFALSHLKAYFSIIESNRFTCTSMFIGSSGSFPVTVCLLFAASNEKNRY